MRSMEQILEEQVRRWEMMRSTPNEKPEKRASVITFTREPGSGGKIIAQKVAESLGLQMFHQEIIHEMAKSAKVSEQLVQTLDENGLSMLEDYIASLVHQKHLWPDQYLYHLLKVIGTIGRHGKAVIVGRGATFILPRKSQISVRIIAPKPFRIEKIARHYKISEQEAERRIIRTNSNRKAFIGKYFHVDAENPIHYNITLNTSLMSIDATVKAICAIFNNQKT